jgi:hypothetical protein
MDRMRFGLIILIALCPLFVLPLGNGQMYTTITANALSTVPVPITVSTYTLTSTMMRNRTSVYSGSFSLPTVPRGVGCSVYSVPFSAAQGDFLSGSFSANNPVNLYVGMQGSVNDWAGSVAACMGPPANILAVPNCNTTPNCAMKSSNFTLTIPQTGKWAIAFVGIQADVNLNAILQSNTIYTTIGRIMSTGFQTTGLQVTTIQPATQSPSAGNTMSTSQNILILAVIAALIVLTILIVRSRKTRKRDKN